jgi:hypothetical protein
MWEPWLTRNPRSNLNEWDKLAKWVVGNKLMSHNVRWLIQVPRLYEVFKASKLVESFEDVVRSEYGPFPVSIFLSIPWPAPCLDLPSTDEVPMY